MIEEMPQMKLYESTHFVVGFNDKSGGILACAKDEFTAYRYAKMLKKEFPETKVLETNQENIIATMNQIEKFIENII